MCHGNGIKFEHFSSDALRRSQNARKRTSPSGRPRGPSPHGSKSQQQGLHRRRRKEAPVCANPQRQTRIVTPKSHFVGRLIAHVGFIGAFSMKSVEGCGWKRGTEIKPKPEHMQDSSLQQNHYKHGP
ncbi:hypothetical protein FQA47_009192 [Oryzias melastigma]|uniref:Uncharacterized protein n=1 Tax=Oryzias melastigma TaxID=30732 RepID=A0A834FLR0_ORYME|nr:hypothetical protein FQA47_009192 [Oryzias melastigma]